MSTCRINPTPNGLMHLGHAFLAYVNQHEARSTGGRLTLIFDDTQPAWIQDPGVVAMRRFSEAWVEDLEWLGVTFDRVVYQSEWRLDFKHWLADRGLLGEFTEHELYPEAPEVVGAAYLPYPYDAFLTVEKIFFDSLAGVDLLIRGEDLLGEYALYQDLWRQWAGLPLPHHVYLPRLSGAREFEVVSKTNGEHKVRQYRERGFSADQVREMLSFACLRDPHGPFSVDNVKAHPRLIGTADWWQVDPRDPIHASACDSEEVPA